MITITRQLARQLRSVFRRAGLDKHSGPSKDWLAFRAGPDGLRIQALSDEIAIEHHQPGELESAEFLVPRGVLATVEGTSEEVVQLEHEATGKVVVTWTDAGIPQIREYALSESAGIDVKTPGSPQTVVANPAQLREALCDATAIADPSSGRYALGCLQLRGQQGRIVATDGRQILAQGGFEFPWHEDLLVPASKIFRSGKELSDEQSIEVGLIDNWVSFRFGAWTVWLAVNQHGRFPRVDDLIGDRTKAASRVELSDLDAQFLTQAIWRLPDADSANGAVTVDLDGQVLVRAKQAGSPRATELVLSSSTLHGEHIALNTNRSYLAKALELGFREICVFNPCSPALCDDGRRQYRWGLLEPDSIVRPAENSIRVDSSTQLPSVSVERPSRARQRLTLAAISARSNGAGRKRRHEPHSAKPIASGNTSIEQAIVLKTALRESLIAANGLIRMLKRERRQSRLLTSTLASLKQLQRVAG
jgi:hypothetical protein